MVVEAILATITFIALLFALRCWLEVRRWANLIAHTRITVAYKRKVKLDPPLQEWALWANQLKDNAPSRVVYLMGGTTVMIRKEPRASSALARRVRAKRMREGTWEAKDETLMAGGK